LLPTQQQKRIRLINAETAEIAHKGYAIQGEI